MISPDVGFYDDEAHLYGLAFSYRDVSEEVSRLAGWASALGLGEPNSALELAAGPADHAQEFARRGANAAALDLSAAMCRYAQNSAAEAGVSLEVVCANMIDFQLAEPVELAFTLINSLAHVHTLDELVAHFAAVERALVPGGLYVIELGHPRDFLGRGGRTTGVSQPWQVERDGVTLTTRWGLADDEYDAVAQLFHASVQLTLVHAGQTRVVNTTIVMRDWTLDEVRAASRLAGGALVPVACFGDFEGGPVTAEAAWRAIFVFRREAPSHV
ncbi:class I SAM-dependent methyltransferase [Enhygromyxa salina]|uniref:dTDP-3-amino-3,4, 6-trideoxy-alpha-D-glucopyranose n=1 Tax=Enhygromyxa salina TaxID=215803 RepID=A0A2S9YNK1_9BACT|nr:class I SAM-dependent methyltransferase [Enhygromyxa salina]PRQ06671.1 dTDP-3-amino-3,4,6-trideoxy-alpha-D-glucopyranose [Enhygromyxa salina]